VFHLSRCDSCLAGISGRGKGQSQLTLSAGVKYYTSVRAITGAGHVLESTADGFSVDATSPVMTVTSVGATAANTTTVLYQKDKDSYTAAWAVDDPGSGVTGVTLTLGSYPGRLVDWGAGIQQGSNLIKARVLFVLL